MGAGKPGSNVGVRMYRWMMAGAEQEMEDMEGVDVSEFADCPAEASSSRGRNASERDGNPWSHLSQLFAFKSK